MSKSIGGGALGAILGGLFALPTGGMSVLAGMGYGAAAGGLAGMSADMKDAAKMASSVLPQATAELPATPQVVDEAGTAGAAVTAVAKAKSKRAAMARSKTIFTSPLGLTEESELNTKTLLGK